MYKIEIWQHGSLEDWLSCDNLDDIKKWYADCWLLCYNNGGCTFYIFEDGVKWDFDKEWNAGFYSL